MFFTLFLNHFQFIYRRISICVFTCVFSLGCCEFGS